VEEVGTGTNKIIRWCKEWELPEPEFEDTGTGFVLTFRRFHVSESLLERLNERQKRAVEYLKEHSKITNREYQKLCASVNRETIRKDLNDLINKKIIIRRGEKKGIYYELI
jgi:ATP-dependent DNA helicase RecG